MKVTRRQLRRIICEYYEHMLAKGHVDGAQWSGTLENLAMVQSKTWGHGAVVDPKGWHEDIKLAGRWTQGTVNERRLRRIIKEKLQFPDDVLVDSDSQDYQRGYADAYDGLKMQKNQSQQYQDGWHDGQLDIIRDKDPTWD